MNQEQLSLNPIENQNELETQSETEFMPIPSSESINDGEAEPIGDPMIMPIKNFIDGHWNGKKVQNIQWRGLLRAQGPISSSSGSNGNISELATEKIFGPDNQLYDVPSITGNAMCANILRMAGADYLITRLGLQNLSPAALDLLYKGGMLESPSERKKRGKNADSGSINFALFNEANKCWPLLGVLGCAIGTAMEESRIQSNNLRLLCKETAHIVPSDLLDGIDLDDSFAYRGTQTHVRLDPKRQKHYQDLMNQSDAAAQLAGMTGEGDEKEKSNLLMPFDREYVCAGSYWYWSFRLRHVTTIEFGGFLTALNHWRQFPHVGGRKNRGYGEFRFVERKSSWLPDLISQFPKAINDFNNYLDEHRDRLVGFLEKEV